MKRVLWPIVVLASVSVLLPGSAVAAGQHGDRCASCPCCAGGHDHAAAPQAERTPDVAAPGYDLSLEQSISGVVVSTQTLPGSNELLVTVSNGENAFEVQVGPAEWMTSKGYRLVPGDRIEIVGSMVLSEGNDTIVARQIWKAGEEMKIRDRTGGALWTIARDPS